MQALALYYKSARILMRGQLQYRSAFFMQALAQVIMMGTELLGVLVLFERFTHLGQWSRAEILFFFGSMTTAFASVEWFGRGFSVFGSIVRAGTFDRLLLRPQGTVFTVLSSAIDPRRLGAMLVGFFALYWGATQAQVQWSLAKAVCMVLSIGGGAALCLGLFMIEATLCFWSVQSIEMINILTYGGRSTCQYPLDIFPRAFRFVFLFVAPYGLTLHLPAAYILGRPMLGFPIWTAFVSPLVGLLFLAATTLVWRRGVRHYTSTGS